MASSADGSDAPFEDAPEPPSFRNSAKKAMLDFFVEAIAKAEANIRDVDEKPTAEILRGDLIKDLSGNSGLCVWHSRKLTEIVQQLKDDRYNIEKLWDLEWPLNKFFERNFGSNDPISAKEYNFYDGVEFDAPGEQGGGGEEPRRIPERRTSQSSTESRLPAEDALDNIQDSLKNWIDWLHSQYPRENKARRIKAKFTRLFSKRTSEIDGSRGRTLLGASPNEFHDLLSRMSILITTARGNVAGFGMVTSSRHHRALHVLQDDMNLESEPKAHGRNRPSNPSVPRPDRGDTTPYSSAQALAIRVEDWVKHQEEACKSHDWITERFFKRGWAPYRGAEG